MLSRCEPNFWLLKPLSNIIRATSRRLPSLFRASNIVGSAQLALSRAAAARLQRCKWTATLPPPLASAGRGRPSSRHARAPALPFFNFGRRYCYCGPFVVTIYQCSSRAALGCRDVPKTVVKTCYVLQSSRCASTDKREAVRTPCLAAAAAAAAAASDAAHHQCQAAAAAAAAVAAD